MSPQATESELRAINMARLEALKEHLLAQWRAALGPVWSDS